ncbi:signal peptide peptidase SppA [Desulfolithobacter sp.]
MKKFFIMVTVLLRWIWKVLTTGLTMLGSLLTLGLVFMVVSALFYHPATEVPVNAALIMRPEGRIVEKKSLIDPLGRVFGLMAGGPMQKETLLQDILDTINQAAVDDRIQVMVLDTSALEQAGFNQLRAIGLAIEQFRDSGKVVIARGPSYSQAQYYLSSWADEIYLNPMGSVDLRGFGIFRLYMKDLIDQLQVRIHIFKVGSYKSAVEPFIRNNMSPEARESNRFWLANIWNQFTSDIANHRKLDPTHLDEIINNLPDYLQNAGGDSARMAVDTGLVDGLKTEEELEQYLRDLVGPAEDGYGFRRISFREYLGTLTPSYTMVKSDRNRIALIIAQGNIVYGNGTPDQISADNLIAQIRSARRDRNVRALVLRIDSGGGSAFASELIRQELQRFQDTGRPLVVSMGSMAASGAYWLAAGADHIMASPVTLTGSIGVFGAMATLENSLERIGVHSDGTGTTRLAGSGSLVRPLAPEIARSIQYGVEHTYNRFLDIVGQGRGMKPDEVEKIAEGRVWDGKTALEINLVDSLGTLSDAVDQAARLAELTEYSGTYVQPPGTSLERLLQRFVRQTSIPGTATAIFPTSNSAALNARNLLDLLLKKTDPRAIYALCLVPGQNLLH